MFCLALKGWHLKVGVAAERLHGKGFNFPGYKKYNKKIESCLGDTWSHWG